MNKIKFNDQAHRRETGSVLKSEPEATNKGAERAFGAAHLLGDF